MPSRAQILAYATRIARARPDISREDMRLLLEAKFLHDRDVFALAPGAHVGAITNPIDWLRGLHMILAGVTKLIRSKKPDVAAIRNIIEGVLVIVLPAGK